MAPIVPGPRAVVRLHVRLRDEARELAGARRHIRDVDRLEGGDRPGLTPLEDLELVPREGRRPGCRRRR